MTFCINMNINNKGVSVIFDWTGRDEDSGPDWDTIEVHALLPIIPQYSKDGPQKHWVIINDLLSDDDWKNIESEIYVQWKELERQFNEQDY